MKTLSELSMVTTFQNCRMGVLCGAALLTTVCMVCSPLRGQTVTAAQTPARLPNGSSPYLTESGIAPLARVYLVALGDRLQKPGSERYVLTGVATDDKYGSNAAKLVWQVPGSVRFERGGGAPWLIYNSATGLVTKAAVSEEDQGVWESVLDDTAEAFLYGFGRGDAYRFLGGRFRPEGTDQATYAGPLYDIFVKHGPVRSLAGSVTRDKYFYFDSVTNLPTRTVYQVLRDGKTISVSTEFSDWGTTERQAFPGKITRVEDGKTTFVLTVKTVTVSQFVGDGTFSGQ